MANGHRNSKTTLSQTPRRGKVKNTVATSSTTPEKEYSCPECTKAVKNHDSIECIKCEEWYHKKCSGLDDNTFECLSRNAACDWTCETCFSFGIERKKETTKIDKMFETMMTKFCEIVERLDKIEKRRENDETNLDKLIDKKVEQKVEEVLEERREGEKRTNNIIISNFPEIEEDSGNNEEECMVRYFENEAPVKKSDIAKAYRLGKKRDGKPRLLKVELKDKETKEQIKQAAIRINKGKEFKQRTYVNDDLTPKQREKEAHLRRELKSRREAGESDLIIRNGQIVSRTSIQGTPANSSSQ